jgi:serine/threonine protein kinase
MLETKFANDACAETMAAPDMDTLQAPPAPEEPLLFDRYRTIRELGRGGMGVVLLAHDTFLDLQVALKLIPQTVVRDTEGIVDLKKEVLRGISLTHPAIVRVFSFEQDSTTAAIVMEHVEGQTLAQKKSQSPGRCFDSEEILPWLEQLCVALDYAHGEARIAHRDLKPANLMLTSAGRLKVADFGIASSLSETVSRVSVRSDGSGTPPYMSPQQARGERPTHLDDIYSLGATIFELLTGKPPFFRGNILAQVIHEDPPTMTARREEFGVLDRSSIPDAWEKMVASCLAKEPEHRPQSGAAILELLKHPERAIVLRPALHVTPVIEFKLEPVAEEKPEQPNSLKPAVRQPVKPVRWQADEPVERSGGPSRILAIGSAAVSGLFAIIEAVLRPVIKIALVFLALWGCLLIKGKWDALAAKRDADAAALRVSQRQMEPEQVAPNRAQPQAAQPTIIVMPPPPPHGPGPGGMGPPPRRLPPRPR